MNRSTLATLAITVGLAFRTGAALQLNNGSFDNDPDLGAADDTVLAPSGWFVRYTVPQSWADFRFGNDGNGAWNNNGLALGQNFLGENFDPGPEDGYCYTSLGLYSGELSLSVSGLGYSRVNGNAAGAFDVGVYYSSSFVGADGVDVAGSSVLLGSLSVDISSLTGTVGLSQAFGLNVN